MTTRATKVVLRWAEKHNEEQQKVLAREIENSQESGEEVTTDVVKEIIKLVERTIRLKNI